MITKPMKEIISKEIVKAVRQMGIMKWIKVEEALPDYDEDVLVFGQGWTPSMGGIRMITRRVDMNAKQFDWVRRRNDKNGFAHMSYVSHWMPLPEDPKD